MLQRQLIVASSSLGLVRVATFIDNRVCAPYSEW